MMIYGFDIFGWCIAEMTCVWNKFQQGYTGEKVNEALYTGRDHTACHGKVCANSKIF